jgi:hypothetical protein
MTFAFKGLPGIIVNIWKIAQNRAKEREQLPTRLASALMLILLEFELYACDIYLLS